MGFKCGSVLFVVFLVAVFVPSFGDTNNEECGPHYCDNKRFPCPLIQCVPGSAPLVKPELCRCCTKCYKIMGK